jgi:hypothetical protein
MFYLITAIKPAAGSKVWSEAAKLKFHNLAFSKYLVGLVCSRGDEVEGDAIRLRLVDTSLGDTDVLIDEEIVRVGFGEQVNC